MDDAGKAQAINARLAHQFDECRRDERARKFTPGAQVKACQRFIRLYKAILRVCAPARNYGS